MHQEAGRKAEAADLDVPELTAKIEKLTKTVEREEKVRKLYFTEHLFAVVTCASPSPVHRINLSAFPYLCHPREGRPAHVALPFGAGSDM